jgi:hypothetical protein
MKLGVLLETNTVNYSHFRTATFEYTPKKRLEYSKRADKINTSSLYMDGDLLGCAAAWIC